MASARVRTTPALSCKSESPIPPYGGCCNAPLPARSQELHEVGRSLSCLIRVRVIKSAASQYAGSFQRARTPNGAFINYLPDESGKLKPGLEGASTSIVNPMARLGHTPSYADSLADVNNHYSQSLASNKAATIRKSTSQGLATLLASDTSALA